MLGFLRYSARFCVHFVRRFLWLGGVLLLFSAMAGVLFSRYWLLPNIERFHDQVAYAVGNAVGQPVNIGHIEADWNGFRPHLLMINVRFLDRSGQVTLALEKVESEVAWTTLVMGQLRLYSLVLDQPDLTVRRDAKGGIAVAGMQLSSAPSDGKAADWLLNQSRIEVRDARITWDDEKRTAAPLVFNDVNLLIENGWWSRHRFAMTALPPESLSAQLDLRGDFTGSSFSEPADWRGQLYTRLDYADVAAWRAWVDLPVPLTSGKGALRGWVDVAGGDVSQMTADLALSDVRTRLGPDLPPLNLSNLIGRIGWHDGKQGMEVYTRQLSLRLQNGYALAPTDFYLRYALSPDQKQASGEVRANKLDLLGLSTLSEYLPFNRSFKRKLAQFAPRGRVQDLHADWNWQSESASLLRFKLKARFDGMAMRPVDGIPGFSGLSGQVDGSDGKGTLFLDSRKLGLDAPGILLEKLQFDTVSANVSWETGWRGLTFNLNKVMLANSDLEGNLSGTYRSSPGSPGIVNINGHLSRAMVQHVARYIPIGALAKDAHDWLGAGLAGGRSNSVDLQLSGDLAKFPFPDPADGVFRISARMQDVAVQFLKDWPRIERIQGDFMIDGSRLEVHADSAATAGNRMQNIKVAIPNLLSPVLLLQAYGESRGETARAVQYIRNSPVNRLLGGFFSTASARGNGELKLRLDIPLRGGSPVKVDGDYHLLGCDLDLGSGIPLLQQGSGDVLFTDDSVRSRNLEVQTLGGPARISIGSENGGKTIRVKASGTADMDELRKVASHPLLRYLHGGSPWDLAVTVQDGKADVAFNSSLSGLTSNLPAPFDKLKDQKVPLHLAQEYRGDRQEQTLQYGDLVEARLTRVRTEGQWSVQQGVIAFGKPTKLPHQKGLWLIGQIPHFSLVGWTPLLGLLAGEGGNNSGSGAGIEGVNLTIGSVTGFGQSITGMHITAHSQDGELLAHLVSRQLSGRVVWQPHSDGTPPACLEEMGLPAVWRAGIAQDGGKLAICLNRLALVGEKQREHGKGTPAPDAEEGEGKPVPAPEEAFKGETPEIHLAAGSLSYQGKALGKLYVRAKQTGGNWSLDKVILDNPDGMLTASGKWETGEFSRTSLDFNFKIIDIGRALSRAGYPGTVKDGHGTLNGSLSWDGGPGDFNYSELRGQIGLVAEKGQFLKINKEVSGLLRILSLQAFSPVGVFSDGFVFDSLSGAVQIRQGVLVTTADFTVKGAALQANLSGQVDLNKETQTLKLVVEPSVSGGAALLLASIVNPLVAVEFWVVNKLFRGPVEKVASVTFNVSGTWDHPVVSKIGDEKAAPAGPKE